MYESVPGGRYLVGGVYVNANGEALAEQGDIREDLGGFDVDGANKAELVAEAERRGLVVTRADGDADKRPAVEDYRAALR